MSVLDLEVTFAGLRLETDATAPGIVCMVINRPAKRNAFSLDMWLGLIQACNTLAQRNDVRAVVVHGLGGHFCAGADIGEFPTLRASPEQAQQYQSTVERAVRALLDLPMATIAAIEGTCIGGGVDIVLACDIRIAHAHARFAVTPARIGLVYSAWEARLLADAVGRSWAKRMLFTGQTLSSETALRIGLIDEVVAHDPYATALALGKATAANAVLSVRAAKLALGIHEHSAADLDVDRLSQAAMRSRDYQEGIRAFLEKRPPQFDGHPHARTV